MDIEGNYGYGSRVGPALFQLDDDFRKVVVAFTWVGVMSDGTVNNTDDCQILASVSAPDFQYAMRSSSCTHEGVNGFRNHGNIVEYELPGTYTATVLDELTGISGSITFEVIP